MATLALAAVGAAVGSTLLPAGFTVLGATLSGAAIGAQIGAFAGSYVDQSLFGAMGGGQNIKGPRLADLHVTASTEGAPIPRVYGHARLGGQVIWADEIEEVSKTRSAGGGGKGIGGGGPKTTTYSYFASFAVAVAEGTVSGIGKVWADGEELDLSKLTYRVYVGSETQHADDYIAAKLGVARAPAFRGVAYIMFERMPLADYGNRIPQLSFEVFRDVDDFADDVRAIVLIPGSGEFVYAPESVSRGLGGGTSQSENVHTLQGGSDWAVSLDQLQTTLPQVGNVSLVVSWFGTDLRAGVCQIKPGVDAAAKVTTPISWSVAGVERANAHLISSDDGRAAYGGTPSDQTVVAAIRDLKVRGFGVTLTPFLLMDVPASNTLTDPYTGSNGQPAFPWRGRITCNPAPGQSATVDKTAAAAGQISNFVGSVTRQQFSISGDLVNYSGPSEWSFRRMVLHYAHLAKAAGGVDAFVIGSELRGLSTVRSSSAAFPFVDAMVALAADVKAVLGPLTKVTYAADWSEFFGYQPSDGSADVYFHLDPLWASAAIDAIGIDLYWPLSDWRDGRSHLDYLDGVRSINDLSYLAGNVSAGEGFDWYYASAAARNAQLRTPITDGAGKPWVFRYKDIKSWWSALHYNRPGGIETSIPTEWVAQSKPFWLMEIGCPSVDKGANQPNVFVDPKSSENTLPYFSRGRRDDFMQRQYLKALMRAFTPGSQVYSEGANPVSAIYGGRMVDLARMYIYAWDARPYPAFPDNMDAWGDGENWRLGHWLNGRAANAPLPALLRQMLQDFEFSQFDVETLSGEMPGYVIDHVMSAREALQPLSLAFFVDAVESGGRIVFRHRGAGETAAQLSPDDLVEKRADQPLITLTRGQETELPASAKVTYIGAGDDYRQAVAESRRLTGASGRVAQAELPIVLIADQAQGIADTWLHETWIARERAAMTLPPSRLGVEPGDLLSVDIAGVERLFRVTEVGESGTREIEARAIDPAVYDVASAAPRPSGVQSPVLSGVALLYFLDLPLLRGDEPAEVGYAIARQEPWPGGIAIYRTPDAAGYTLISVVDISGTLGTLLDALPSGPHSRLDRATRVRVEIAGGALFSVTLLQMLAGSNAAAVRNVAGEWEVLQFNNAVLISPGIYELSGFLRGQAGTEGVMSSGSAIGAPFVLLDEALTPIPLTANDIGLPYTWRYGPVSRDLGDATYASASHSFGGVGLRPYAPAHVRGARNVGDGGDLAISWIRRTRIGGDSWEIAEVPVGEAAEQYEIDILDGTSVKRTLTSPTSMVVYPAAQQIADFGDVQDSCTVRVHQVSAVFGRGPGRVAQV